MVQTQSFGHRRLSENSSSNGQKFRRKRAYNNIEMKRFVFLTNKENKQMWRGGRRGDKNVEK